MTIDEQISQYCEKKETEKSLDKEIKVLSGDIKKYLTENKAEDKQVGGWKVTLQHKISENVDEAKLLLLLKEFWNSAHPNGEPCPFVAHVEVVDMSALEGALYRDEIPQEVILKIDGCRVKKETTVLVYSKVKEE